MTNGELIRMLSALPLDATVVVQVGDPDADTPTSGYGCPVSGAVHANYTVHTSVSGSTNHDERWPKNAVVITLVSE